MSIEYAKKSFVFVNPVYFTSQSSSLLSARTIICTHRILVRCYSIIIEQDSETCRKLKKEHLMCKLIIFLPFCYFPFFDQFQHLITVKLMTLHGNVAMFKISKTLHCTVCEIAVIKTRARNKMAPTKKRKGGF